MKRFWYYLLIFTIVNIKSTMMSAKLPSQPGECMITGYFAIHSPQLQGDTMKCGTINTMDGIVLLEAFRYAINVTNRMGILPKGIALGYNVYDTCKSTVQLKSHISPTLFSASGEKLIGIVGPYSSSEAVLSTSVFSVFKMTEISYKAASLELEDRGRYNNFFRTVPSDRYEVMAILDVIRHFRWNYVSCVSSHQQQQGMLLMIRLIEDDLRCVAKHASLPEIPNADHYENAIDVLRSDAKAKVVILFTTAEDTMALMAAAKKQGYGKGIVWLGGTGWGNLVFDNDLGKIANGAITLNYVTHTSQNEFKKYFSSLTPANNNYSYFIEFWEKIFGCTFNQNELHSKPPCTSREKLGEHKMFPPFTAVGPVMDAVFIYAQALRYALKQMCAKQDHACFKQHYFAILGWFLPSLSSKTFSNLDGMSNITFDKVGGVPGQFEMLNYVWTETNPEYKVIGRWQAGTGKEKQSVLAIDKPVHWDSGNGSYIVSKCSQPCDSKRGQVKERHTNGKEKNCCWKCKLCDINDMISKNDTCSPCGNDFKPDPWRTRCIKLKENAVSYSHPVGITAIVLSSLGMLLTTLVVGLFIYFNKSPIVKASGRELSYFMLIGIYICFTAPIIFMSPPSKHICAMQRFIAGLSLNFCYAPLLLKTNRLYRIFKNATLSVSRPVLTSPASQIIICLGITSVQILVGVVWTIGDPPTVYRHYPPNQDFVMLYCKTDAYIMELNLCVCLVLMLACTWFAFKTRNFPKNFNETKSTMLTMYASCLVWGIFLPIFILSDNRNEYSRSYTIVIFCDVIAYVTLIGLFAPRIRLLFWPGMVTDASQTGVVSRGDVVGLKKNTLMSRAILSSYPVVTAQYVNPVVTFENNDTNNDIATSTTDLQCL
eukprot:gene4606-5212_t